MTAESITFIAYICLALLVGVWGQRKGYSFGVGFIVSLLLTFVVGAVVVVVLKDKETGRRGILTWSM
jgi:F0F1-type ATP synthase assembly protein I